MVQSPMYALPAPNGGHGAMAHAMPVDQGHGAAMLYQNGGYDGGSEFNPSAISGSLRGSHPGIVVLDPESTTIIFKIPFYSIFLQTDLFLVSVEAHRF